MFVNKFYMIKVLFRDENVACVFDFGMLECCSLQFYKKNSKSVIKLSKATKVIKILYLLRNADVSKFFCSISMSS